MTVVAHFRPGGYEFDLPGGRRRVQGAAGADGELVLDMGGARILARVVRRGDELTVFSADVTVVAHFRPGGYEFDLPGGRRRVQGAAGADGEHSFSNSR
ncbi:hypothetical protein [Mycobacterium tuberculosis]|uniref:hypothetical protein n=1 Tax=Mycobacterium tuberculosis TaxID=1773 RepID=UPI00272BE893|nr:hypothetical protein [Mycobacterium tuberculosis]